MADNWTQWAPDVLQSEDCRWRIYRSRWNNRARYTLKRSDADRVWSFVRSGESADELKAMCEEELNT